jgi:hypothetical protein
MPGSANVFILLAILGENAVETVQIVGPRLELPVCV